MERSRTGTEHGLRKGSSLLALFKCHKKGHFIVNKSLRGRKKDVIRTKGRALVRTLGITQQLRKISKLL